MKFKVKKDSATGRSLAELEKKMQKAHDEARSLADELGFESWRQANFVAYGGISCVFFIEDPDPKLWRKYNGGYYPKKNSNEGKALAKRIDDLSTISNKELYESVGFKESITKSIGMDFHNSEFYGFDLNDDWEYTPPKDCIEITTSEYKKLFKKS